MSKERREKRKGSEERQRGSVSGNENKQQTYPYKETEREIGNRR